MTHLEPLPERVDTVPRPYLRIGVTGHRRLPDAGAVAAQVARALRRLCDLLHAAGSPLPRFGVVSSLAEGADRLVAEAVLTQQDADLVAVLPLAPTDYRGDFTTGASRHAFDILLARARCTIVLPSMPSRDDAYLEAGRQVLARCDVLFALWDGLPARGRGGTAEIVAEARAQGVPLIWIQTEPPFTSHAERLAALGARMAGRKTMPLYAYHVCEDADSSCG